MWTDKRERTRADSIWDLIMIILAVILFAQIILSRPARSQNVGPTNQIFCNQIINFTGSAALTQMIPAVAGQRIFICGWHITNTAAAGTWLLSTGTGANCGTGTAALIAAESITSTAPAADHIEYAQIQGPIGAALCQNSTATVAGIFYFAQF